MVRFQDGLGVLFTMRTALGIARILTTAALLPSFSMFVWGVRNAPSGRAPLTSLRALHEVDNAEAVREIPTSFEATVVYSRGNQRLLFVQDHDQAIFVFAANTDSFAPGDRVHIVGKTEPSFRPIVAANSVTLIHHGEIPNPTPATFHQLIRGELDSRLVTVRAKVRAADLVPEQSAPFVRSARLELVMAGGHLEAYLDTDQESVLKSMLDAEVEITGAAAGKFDDKMQQTGIVLYVSKLADLRIWKRAPTNPWSLKPIAMDQILSRFQVNDLSQRVRVFGTITYDQPGSAVVLESGSKSLWISTESREPLHVGDIASAIGFPNGQDRVLSLVDAEVQDSGIQAPVPPHSATWDELALWDSSKAVGHQFDLVSTEGDVIAEVRGALEDEYVLSESGRLFSAIYRHPSARASLAPMRQVPLKSRIRVTGICLFSDTRAITPGEQAPFEILLRSFDDIQILRDPPLLSIRNLLFLVAVLLALLFTVGARAWISERLVRHQNASMAYTERKRARILEGISSSRPVEEILEEITEMASFKLHGLPCWCELSDGARVGNWPQDPGAFRLRTHEILSQSGSPLGTVSLALSRQTARGKEEWESLSIAASLIALALETRRLHFDLVHRSEFDQLTEIHNRFSFGRYLDQQILEARNRGLVFAIVYIDLNDFKKVNDQFGHLVGDLYLSEAARRMKQELRGSDMLARLGGDEFAVLLPTIHNRGDVEEILERLERAFDAPFDVAAGAIHGSASFGCALYPEDGTSQDELLGAADAAMYVSKQMKKEMHPPPS